MNNFEKIYEKLKPYLKNTKKIKFIKEYKEVVENYSNYWTHVAVIFVIPKDNFNISKTIKKKALQLREKTQKFNEALEPVFKEFIETKYPYLKGKYRFILPNEIINGNVNNKSLILKRIKQREKGFVYYKNKLYIGDINKTLNKLNLIL